ncbi:MAG: tetratricopeptide repeat protein, partial [Cyanobacteria bacterium]|nr:tetratricopeptide repeat protein [Cyanobacteriota bacterium]
MKQDKKAVEDFSHAIAIYPNFSYYYLRAVSLNRLDKVSQAVEDLEHAIKLKPDHVHTYNMLASLYRDRGDLDNSVLAIKRGFRNCPKGDLPHLHFFMSTLL